MIYLNNLLITEDYLLEKSRSTHELFKQKKEVIKGNSGYRNKTDITIHYFKLFEKGLSIDFKNDITIIVGDNGTGKTSLINLIQFEAWEYSGWSKPTPEEEQASIRKHMQDYLKGESRTLTFKELPQNIYLLAGLHKEVIGGQIKEDVKKASLSGKNFAQLTANMFSFADISNGEALLDLYEPLTKTKDSLIILDEPETSMSLKSINNLCDTFKTLAKNNNQLIISTHHPYFMELVDEIYDIEKKRYTPTDKYLKSFKRTAK